MKVTHVDALLLTLASAKIIEIQVNKSDRWNLCRTSSHHADAGVPAFQNNERWQGVNLHDEGRPRRRNADLLLKKPKATNTKAADGESSDSGSPVMIAPEDNMDLT